MKKIFRAIIFMLLLLSFVFGLSACGGNDEQVVSQTMHENNQNIVVDSFSQNPSNSGAAQGNVTVVDVQTSPMVVMAGSHNAITMFYLTGNGELWAWGRGEQGQLGNGTTQDSFTPVRVQLENIISVVTGGFGMRDNIFALDSNGIVYAWGFGYEEVDVAEDGTLFKIYGSLGIGESTVEIVSVPMPLNLPRIREIVTGEFDSVFAITEDGDVFTWGGTDFVSRIATYDEQLIPGTMTSALRRIFEPKQIPGLSNIVQIYTGGMGATGSVAVHAVDSNGNVWVWGGLQGNLGVILGEINANDATIFISPEYNDGVPLFGIAEPIRLTKIRDVERIIDMTTLFMQNGARWGLAGNNFIEIQLGHEQIIDHTSAFIPHHNDVSFFIDNNGYLHQPFLVDFWHESEATVGISPSRIVNFDPNPLHGINNVTSMVLARPIWNTPQYLLLFMKEDGTVWSYEVPNAPVQLTEIFGAVSMQAIDNSIFVILDNGDIWTWGNNRGGRLGMGFAEDSTPDTVVENPVLLRFD